MNRHSRRAAQAREETPEQLVARANREGYALFAPTAEHAKKIGEIQLRIFQHFDDVSCFDVFMVCLTLSTVMSVYGAENKIDRFPVQSRETFLKNCSERYDGMMAAKTTADATKKEPLQ